jgi:hypothetical protein
MDNQDGRLWTPSGVSSTHERQVAQAIREYDQDLILGQRSDGEWVVFLKPATDAPPFPALGFGYELPSVDQVKGKLYRHDVSRNSRGIYSKMLRSMDDSRKRVIVAGEEKMGQVAEAMEAGFRNQGAHPNPRIFVPRGVR